MKLLDKIDLLTESGIKNINKWAKKFKKATIYFHMDLDGVTSAIGIKNYLNSYGIKTEKVIPINYGGTEYAVKKPEPGTLVVMVDFAHSKPVLDIWTDHHDSEHIGARSDTSVAFVKAPANATHISMTISPKDLFPQTDLKVISMVDSADFAKYGVTPDDVMRAVYGYNKDIDVERNHMFLGLVTNKLLLAYKNKPGFLEDVVMKSKSSLISMYNVIKSLAKQAGYSPPKDIEQHKKDYIEASSKAGTDKLERIGNVIVQRKPPASMIKTGSYDRYVIFKNNPDAEYAIVAWPMGLIQVSKNPFISGANPYHLGDMAKQVLAKYKSKLENIKITLDTLKWTFERDIQKKGSLDSMGFTFDDFISLFKDRIESESYTQKFKDVIKDITNKKMSELSKKQKEMLSKVWVTVFDIIEVQSGGHKDITNIQGLNFIGKNYRKFMEDFIDEILKQMKGFKLDRQ